MKKSEVLNYFNGKTKAVADAIGVSSKAVLQWGEYPPKGSQILLAIATNNNLKPELDCLPDGVSLDYFKAHKIQDKTVKKIVGILNRLASNHDTETIKSVLTMLTKAD